MEAIKGIEKQEQKLPEIRPEERILVDTPTLQAMLCCGKQTAQDIGFKAKARIKIGRRCLWKVDKIKSYLNTVEDII